MNDVDKILAALDSLMQSKGAGEGIWRAAQLGDVTARSLVNKAARDIDKLQEMTGPKMYQAIEQAEIKALADRAGVSEEEMLGRLNTDEQINDRGGTPDDFPSKYLGEDVPRGAFTDADKKYGYQFDDPNVLVDKGLSTKKAEEQLAKFRASLRASEDIVGGEPRLVSDKTPSGFPASKYGVGDAFNQTLRDEDWNNAYLEGRKLGLSDRDAKMVARMKIGQSATQDVEGRPGVRQAINETEMTDLRRALTAQAAESLDPYVGPNYQEQKVATEPIDPYWYTAEGKEELLDYAADKAYSDTDLARAARKRERFYDLQGVDYDYRDKIEEWKDAWKQGHTIDPDTLKAVPIKAGSITRSGETFDVPVETPSTKKAIQQSQSTPVSTSVKGPRFAGKYAKYVIPLLGGTSGLYLLADALSDNEAERMPAPVDEDEAAKLAAAELLAQAVS